MGTIIITLILIGIVSLVIASLIKEKDSVRQPSCGGHCGSCGHNCSAIYQNVNTFLENQKNLHK